MLDFIKTHMHPPAPPAPQQGQFQGHYPHCPSPRQPKSTGATERKRTWNEPFHPGTKYRTAWTFLEPTLRGPRVSLLLRNKGLVFKSFHKQTAPHTISHVAFSAIVCSFQFRTYPIIYLWSGRPGVGDSSYRKCFCDCRPKANLGADGCTAESVRMPQGGQAGRERPSGKITQV